MHTPSTSSGQHCNLPGDGRTVGESLWVATAKAPSFASLPGNAKAEVVIVGGGITGLTTAYLLQKAGKKVMVVEANTLGKGVTGYTSAHLTYVLDAKFQSLVKRFGVKKMRLVQQSNRACIDLIGKIVKEEKIECDYRACDGYLYAETQKDDDFIKKEFDAAKKIGIGAEYVKEIPLPFATYSGIRFPDQAEFHPLRYIFALANIIISRGGKIYEHTRVTTVKGNRVITEKGEIAATDIVLATHSPILKQLLMVQGKMEPSQSYIVGVKLKDRKTPKGLFWDTDHPYQYIRSYDDVVVIGGKDHPSGMKIDTRQKIAELEAYARKRFDVADIAYAWSAMYFIACDDLPFIGRAPFQKHLYVATGFAGNGLTFGTVSAMLLTDLITGKKNPWAKLYNPNRISVIGLIKLMKFGWNNFRHLVVDRLVGGRGDAKDVKPGEGALVTINGKKIALYRDADGTAIQLSPACTHAGCIVGWNQFEKTWDCPCHGGRYTCSGKVINGPPVKDLERVS